MTTSMTVLTYNRAAMVERCVSHNLAAAGARVDEIVWVDNGSTDGVRDVMTKYDPAVAILHKQNLGVSRGYNCAYAMATGEYITIVDSDFLLPQDWLATFQRYMTDVPNTGIACILHNDLDPHYLFNHTRWVNGLCYLPCSPRGARFLSRELLVRKIGFLRQEFGLYGWEDLEWRRRAVRVCNEEGLLTYAILGPKALHLGVEASDTEDYVEFKRQQQADVSKSNLLRRFEQEGYRYFNPFA